MYPILLWKRRKRRKHQIHLHFVVDVLNTRWNLFCFLSLETPIYDMLIAFIFKPIPISMGGRSTKRQLRPCHPLDCPLWIIFLFPIGKNVQSDFLTLHGERKREKIIGAIASRHRGWSVLFPLPKAPLAQLVYTRLPFQWQNHLLKKKFNPQSSLSFLMGNAKIQSVFFLYLYPFTILKY